MIIKLNQKRKLNNYGSTLIIVLVAVAFISILGTVSVTTAMVSLKMKTVDRQIKKTFYTAEEAVDEIRAGLGMLAMDKAAEAYTAQVSKLLTNDVAGKPEVTVKADNDAANKGMKQQFVNYVLEDIIGVGDGWDPTTTAKNPLYTVENIEKLKEKLSTYFEFDDDGNPLATVEEISDFYVDCDPSKSLYKIIIKKCVIQYVDESGYFSKVTIDGEIAFPDRNVDFVASSNTYLKSYLDYGMIGTQGIDVKGQRGLSSSIFAGGSGLQIIEGGALTIDGTEPDSGYSTDNNINIVSTGDIRVWDSSTLNINRGTSIWCTNLIAGSKPTTTKGKTSGEINITGNNVKTIIKDDLQLEGDSSRVTISGEFFGYSYDGKTADQPDDTGIPRGHANSSAIIVNGTKSSVDISKVTQLVLGGRAYIDFEGSYYRTGQSLSLQGDQEAYLVPEIFMKDASGKTLYNPVSSNTYNEESMKDRITLTANNFFGYQYLDPAKLFATVTKGSSLYIYFNFRSPQASSDYFKAVLDDNVFNALCAGKSEEVKAQYVSGRNYIRTLIGANFSTLQQTSSVSVNPTSKIFTNGSLISINGGIASGVDSDIYDIYDIDTNINFLEGKPASVMSLDNFALTSLDLSNRYLLLTKTLMTKPTRNDDGKLNILSVMPSEVDVDGITVDLNFTNINGTDKTIFEMFVNTDALSSGSYNSPFAVNDGKLFTAYDGSIVVPDGATEGVIIATDDVTLKHSFSGLIIAGGKIHVGGDGMISNKTSDGRSVENLIDENGTIKKYLLNYKSSVGDDGEILANSLKGISFEDFVSFKNWRK